MHAANSACCMAPMLIAASAAGCMPHTPNFFFNEPLKLLQVYYARSAFE
jgi:hypothetical protein